MNAIIKQGLIIGLADLIVSLVFNFGVNFAIPSLALEYQSGLFRPWSDPLMMAFFLSPFILGFALAYFWMVFGKHIEGKTPSEKAINFTKFYFLIATIPGMFISLTSFKVSYLMIGSWTLLGLIEAYVAGWLLAKK